MPDEPITAELAARIARGLMEDALDRVRELFELAELPAAVGVMAVQFDVEGVGPVVTAVSFGEREGIAEIARGLVHIYS